ncbi:MAG: SDR family oxidoreductase [Bacteroidetes bacterium]|nr:SDR family oxidoreductase [Bacteroidota bacterium]
MIAVISGATRGIGRAMAFALAKEGYNLAIGARNQEQLQELKSEIISIHSNIKVLAIKTDFGIIAETKAFASAVLKEGEVGIIVNNVGVYNEGTVSSEADELFEKHIAVNLNSAWYLTRPFLKQMKERQQGHIFNICSTACITPRAEAASYSISKMALYAFHKVLCEEMREFKVKVTAILPGSVNTSSWDGIDALKERFIQPEDIANSAIAALKSSPYSLVEEIIMKPLNET